MKCWRCSRARRRTRTFSSPLSIRRSIRRSIPCWTRARPIRSCRSRAATMSIVPRRTRKGPGRTGTLGRSAPATMSTQCCGRPGRSAKRTCAKGRAWSPGTAGSGRGWTICQPNSPLPMRAGRTVAAMRMTGRRWSTSRWTGQRRTSLDSVNRVNLQGLAAFFEKSAGAGNGLPGPMLSHVKAGAVMLPPPSHHRAGRLFAVMDLPKARRFFTGMRGRAG